MTAIGPLDGKSAIVTGSARGIGRAYALRLAKLGADVAVVDVNLDAASEFEPDVSASVTDEVQALGRRSLGVQADLTRKADIDRMVDEVLGAFGKVDILVNNAGGAFAPIERSYASTFTEEDYDAMFDVNFRSAVRACQAVAPHMKAAGSGNIINISSMAALDPSKRQGRLAHYGTAKSAIISYTRYLAAELGSHGIRVNCISPGTIATSRIRALSKSRGIASEADLEHIPLRRLGVEEDCAGVLEFLVTELSSYVTGQCISVDGGRVLTPS